jgi:hypothetical protein
VKVSTRPRAWLPPKSAFTGFRFPAEVIVVAVRWYLRYNLSYRDVEELLVERGFEVDDVTLFRWVQQFPHCWPMRDSLALDRGVDRDDHGWVVVRWMLSEALVWSVFVEMSGVLVERRAGVALGIEQDAVGHSIRTLRTNRSA